MRNLYCSRCRQRVALVSTDRAVVTQCLDFYCPYLPAVEQEEVRNELIVSLLNSGVSSRDLQRVFHLSQQSISNLRRSS